MKAVISNFSTLKTHISLKTLPAFFLFVILFSCGTAIRYENPRNNHIVSSKEIRSKIVKTSVRLNGVRYRYGGNSPEKGFDCSGFSRYVFNQYGINLPRSSKAQSKIGKKVKLENTKPGDLIFFKKHGKINHVGIVIENTSNRLIIIHSTTSKGVKKDDVLNSTYWKKRITFAKDILTN